MSDWADVLAEEILNEARGKPRGVALQILADSFRKVTSDLEAKLEKAEADVEAFEPAQERSVEPQYIETGYDGFCKDCGIPYAVGETIWWLGPGRGAYCMGCQKAAEWAKELGKSSFSSKSKVR